MKIVGQNDLRNRVGILALLATAVSATAQLSTVQRNLPASSFDITDFDGIWEARDNRGIQDGPITLMLKHRGSQVLATDADPRSPTFATSMFSGIYSGEPSFIVQIVTNTSESAGKGLQVTIVDRMTLRMGTLEFHRLSPARPLPIEGADPSRVLIDLDGDWQERNSNGDDNMAFGLGHQNSELWGTEGVTTSPRYGEVVFRGTYSGQNSFTIKLEGKAVDTATKEFTVIVKDPDNLSINGHIFHRFSKPKLSDLPCIAANPFHVTAEGTVTRSRVAADAERYSIAFCWAAIAGKEGDPTGEYLVADYLRKGVGTSKNPERALEWMLASAKQGVVEAQRAVAQMYLLGEGTLRDFQQSMYWSNRSMNTAFNSMTNEQKRDLALKWFDGQMQQDYDSAFVKIRCDDGAVLELNRERVRRANRSYKDICSSNGH